MLVRASALSHKDLSSNIGSVTCELCTLEQAT